jgi:anti-sigma B factor antagonist
MSLKSENIGGVEVVTLPTQLVMANAAETRAEIRALVADGRTRLILDLSGVEFVDSSGLSVLVSALKAAAPRNGRVVLLAPSAGVRSLIELTRLHQVLTIFEDRDAALEELAPYSEAG